MQYILGIDQGGTKTAAIIMNSEGYILGVGLGKGAYHTEQGIDFAMSSVKEAVSNAESSSGIKLKQITIGVAGMSGMDWPHEYELLKSALINVLGIKEIEVYNDCIIAMYGGTSNNSGVVLCAGTGLNSAVRDKEGKEFILNFYIEAGAQGGSALGDRAIRKMLDSEIGLGAPSRLKEMILGYTKQKDIEEFIYNFATGKIDNFEPKHIVPQVINLAEEGDKVSKDLVNEFGKDLSKYIFAGLNKFNMLNEEVDVVLSGSVFKGIDNILYKAVEKDVRKFAPNAIIINAKYEPVVGAAKMALWALNINLDKKINSNIDNSAEKLGLKRDI